MLLLLACAHSPELVAAAPPEEDAEIEWFDLYGPDRIDLIESCLERCPRDEGGIPVASLTTWQLRWSWVRGGEEACEVADATVDTMVRLQMPRWAPPADADPALVAEWDTWFGALRHHELGHVALVYAFAHDAELRLEDAGCDGIDAMGEGLVRSLRAAELEYDAVTDSGERQGASFWSRERVLAEE